MYAKLAGSTMETWHALMAESVRYMHEELRGVGGLTYEHVAATMEALPVSSAVLAAIRTMRDAGIPQSILSDANDALIGSFLRHHDLWTAFSHASTSPVSEASDGSDDVRGSAVGGGGGGGSGGGGGVGEVDWWPCVRGEGLAPESLGSKAPGRVFTNILRWDAAGEPALCGYFSDGTRVKPHECPHKCPRSMCKGTAMRRSLLPSGHRIVYVGDGFGDICAARSLRPGDVLCARRGFRLAKTLDAQASEDGDWFVSPLTAAHVYLWTTFEEVAALVLRHSGAVARVDSAAEQERNED
jgi:Putative Phosphatase